MPFLTYEYAFLKDLLEVKSLFILVAMDSEEEALLEGVSFEEESWGARASFRVKKFQLGSCEVRVGRSGVGLASAGVLLGAVVERFSVDAVLLLGVGGALDPDLELGDQVVAHQVIQHDSIATDADGFRFIAAGELTLSAAQDDQKDPVMKCDPVWVNWLSSVKHEEAVRVREGILLSGSEFVGNPRRKEELRRLVKDALLVDMEAGALAMLCRKWRIPFGVAKTVVDRALPSQSIENDYRDFLDSAAKRSHEVLKALQMTFEK